MSIGQLRNQIQGQQVFNHLSDVLTILATLLQNLCVFL